MGSALPRRFANAPGQLLRRDGFTSGLGAPPNSPSNHGKRRPRHISGRVVEEEREGGSEQEVASDAGGAGAFAQPGTSDMSDARSDTSSVVRRRRFPLPKLAVEVRRCRGARDQPAGTAALLIPCTCLTSLICMLLNSECE